MLLTANKEEWLTTSEACEYLDVSEATMRRYTREKGIIPQKRGKGRTQYYPKSKLEPIKKYLDELHPVDDQD